MSSILCRFWPIRLLWKIRDERAPQREAAFPVEKHWLFIIWFPSKLEDYQKPFTSAEISRRDFFIKSWLVKTYIKLNTEFLQKLRDLLGLLPTTKPLALKQKLIFFKKSFSGTTSQKLLRWTLAIVILWNISARSGQSGIYLIVSV